MHHSINYNFIYLQTELEHKIMSNSEIAELRVQPNLVSSVRTQ